MADEKKEQRRVVSISLSPALLERLDSFRWAKRITRSRAMQNVLESYLGQEAGLEAGPG